MVLPPGIEPSSTFASNPTRNINPAQNLVQGPRIELGSYALQAYAEITRLAHPAKSFRIFLFQ